MHRRPPRHLNLRCLVRSALGLLIALGLCPHEATAQLLPILLQPRGIRASADSTFVVRGASGPERSTEADVYLLFSKNNPTRTVRRPLIIVEGFYPHHLRQRGVEMPSQLEVLQDFPSVFADHDLVYVAWRDAQQRIESNAQTLITLLTHLSAPERGVIVGHSMGGLVARIALVEMERAGVPHRIDHYISYDTPHLGAYWPLGVMYGAYGVQQFFNRSRDFGPLLIERAPALVDFILRFSDSDAARQMLTHHLAPDGRMDNTLHLAFQRYLDGIGFPHGDPQHPIRLMAVANSPMVQPDVPDEYLTVRFEGKTDLPGLLNGIWKAGNLLAVATRLNNFKAGLLASLPGRTILEGRIHCRPAERPNELITHIEIHLTKVLYWLKPIRLKIYEYQAYQPALPQYLDYCPHSTVSFGALDLHALTEQVPIFDNIRYHIHTAESLPFIPTASALALYSEDPHAPTTPLTPTSSPFGPYIYLTPHPTRHNRFDPDAVRWLYDKCTERVTEPLE